jgi:hypothetical protein
VRTHYGYQGPLFRRAVAKIMARVNVEIIKRSVHAIDWENLNRKALAFLSCR